MRKIKKIAIVQRALYHYREPIYRFLCAQSDNVEYTLFSVDVNHYDSVKTIEPEKARIPVENGGLRWRFLKNKFIGDCFWQSGVLGLSISNKFDVIIYEGSVYYISTWIAIALAKLTGKRVLTWGHGFLSDERGIKGKIRSTFYRLSDGMLLYHNRAKDILVNKGFNPENLYVVYNSLDYDSQVEIREKITKEEKCEMRSRLFKNHKLPIIIFIGRLISRKKLNMIVQSVVLLKNKGLGFNVLFVGDGPEKNELQKLSIENNIMDNICFYGACYNEIENALLISMSDVCVSPGEIGLTCMHSLVYGTPVITHDDRDTQGPEYEAITDGYNGCFFKKDSVEDLASQIEKWFKNNQYCNEVSTYCYEVIDRFYNPKYQVSIINKAVLGDLADAKPKKCLLSTLRNR